MTATARYRNSDMEARERDRFRVLEHVRTRTVDRTRTLHCSRLADELGLWRLEATALIEELVVCGFLEEAAAGSSVRITARGTAYIDQHAGRRRSVRGALRVHALREPATLPGLR